MGGMSHEIYCYYCDFPCFNIEFSLFLLKFIFFRLYFHGADNLSMNYRHHEFINLTLICAEDPVEKNIFQQAIHSLSVRGTEPFYYREFFHSSNEASDGMRQSPRGESEIVPTFGPSVEQLRLNCWVKNRRRNVFR